MANNDSAAKCPNCQANLIGRFCHECGQKKIEENERTFLYFLGQFFGSVFYLENNFFKNLWKLISAPGLLTKEYVEGRRKRWMTPLSLFLLINLVYFLSPPLSDLSLSLYDQLNQPQHRGWSLKMVQEKIQEEEIDFDTYASIYQDKTAKISSTIVMVNVPILAFFFSLVYFRKRMYYADHFVFSLHIFSFTLLVVLFIGGLFNALYYLFNLNLGLAISPAIILTVVNLTYIFVALKRFYQDNVWLTLLHLIITSFLFILTHFFYRTVLFLVTFYAT